MQVDIYVTGNSKRPDSIERWAGYLVRAKGGKKEVTGAACYASTLYASLLMIMVEALDRFTRPADITMHIESDWIIGKLIVGNNGKRVIDMWQEREWKTARGTPVKNKNEWQRLYNKLRVFEQSGGTFKFVSMQEEDEADCDSRGKIARTIERSMTDPE